MPRRPLDFYETPPHYIAALLQETGICGNVYEPCVGDGAIARALRQRALVATNDIDRKHRADYHYDARTFVPSHFSDGYDWIVTNPPFSDEFAILERSFDFAPNLAFLARLSFLEPTDERGQWLEQHPPSQIIVLPRYSFRLNDEGKKQTDSMTCAWLIWTTPNYPRGITFWTRGRSQAQAVLLDLV